MITIAWATGVISIPQSFLTPLGGATYELDLDVMRLALKDLEDDEAGMPWPRTHNHNTEVTLAGITFARSVEIVAPYTIQFEDGAYGVNLVGANSNVPDVLVRNSVSVNTQNSAGLVTVDGGGISATHLTMIEELYRLAGLDATRPLVVTSTSRAAGAAIAQNIVESPVGTVTVTRA